MDPAETVVPEIAKHEAELIELCRRYHVQRLEIFGSAAGLDFLPGHSDFDFLVEFETLPPGAYATTFFALKEALEKLLGGPVDLVVASSIRNPWFRKRIDESRKLLYAS